MLALPRHLDRGVRQRLVLCGTYLNDRERRRGQHRWAEVRLRITKGQIPIAVGSVGTHQCYITDDRFLHHAVASLEATHLSVFGQLRAETDWCKKCGNAGTACADSLGERSLRQALKLDLAGFQQRLEHRQIPPGTACSAADHLAHQAGLDQFVRARQPMRSGVDHQCQIACPVLGERMDQDVCKASAAEAGDHHHGTVAHTGQRCRGAVYTLVDRHRSPVPSACSTLASVCAFGQFGRRSQWGNR
jgi:hypothetical protein